MAAAHWSFGRHIRNGRAANSTPHISHTGQPPLTLSRQLWNCLVYRRTRYPIWTQRPAYQPVCESTKIYIFFHFCNWKLFFFCLCFLRFFLLHLLGASTTGLWNPNTHTTQWHVTTQPNFITKPRPTQWDKLPSRPKPKPTKKPIHFTEMSPPSQPAIIHTNASDSGKRPTTSSTTTTTTSHTSTTKPKPQVIYYSIIFSAFLLLNRNHRLMAPPAQTSTSNVHLRRIKFQIFWKEYIKKKTKKNEQHLRF